MFDQAVDIDDLRLTQLMELTLANEIDVATHNDEFAATVWPAMAPVFDECQALLSNPAWSSYQRGLLSAACLPRGRHDRWVRLRVPRRRQRTIDRGAEMPTAQG